MLERGKRRRTTNLDVFLAASPVSRSRFGVIVAKHGHTIVERNLVKRRLKEIARRHVLPALDLRGDVPIDVLVRARRSAYGITYEVLETELSQAVEKVCSGKS